VCVSCENLPQKETPIITPYTTHFNLQNEPNWFTIMDINITININCLFSSATTFQKREMVGVTTNELEEGNKNKRQNSIKSLWKQACGVTAWTTIPLGIGHSNLATTNQRWIEKSTICAKLWISWPLRIWHPKTLNLTKFSSSTSDVPSNASTMTNYIIMWRVKPPGGCIPRTRGWGLVSSWVRAHTLGMSLTCELLPIIKHEVPKGFSEPKHM